MKEKTTQISARISNSLLSMIKDYADLKSISLNMAIQELISKYFFYNQARFDAEKFDKFSSKYFKKFEALSEDNQNLRAMNLSMIEELQEMKNYMENLKNLMFLIGRHISKEAEIEINEYFHNN